MIPDGGLTPQITMLGWAQKCSLGKEVREMSTTLNSLVTIIAVTGGPCAGKTTMLARARQHFENHGMFVAVIPEVATELIQAGFSPVTGWRASMDFQKYVLKYSLLREELYLKMLEEQDTDKQKLLLCDRGAIDGLAYSDQSEFAALAKLAGYEIPILRERYKSVVHLVTAASGAEEHYTLSNNTARSEGLDLARELDRKTLNAWKGHPHLFEIDNRTDFNGKVRRALASLARVLHMPEPLEKEKKFIIKNWNPSSPLLREATRVRILQDYLNSPEEGVERRVRSRILNGIETYYYTEKKLTSTVGERVEIERQIDMLEYHELIKDHDPQTTTIKKTRHYLSFAGRVLEVDVYERPYMAIGLVVVEVELADMNEEVVLPEEWQVEEVTGNSFYSNHKISRW